MPCEPPVSYADPRDVAELAEPLRSRIAQAIHDAPTGGLVLVSGKRTDYQQWLLRHERVPGHECDPAYSGHPTTALPGHSHHRNTDSLHCAADMGGRDMQWLRDHMGAYGLYLAVPGENWHFEPMGEPSVPITPFGQHADPNAGRQWVAIQPGATDRSVYAAGGFDNEVSEVQIRLAKLAAHVGHVDLKPGPIDGNYGPTGQRAIQSFKAWIIAIQHATKQTPWPNTDTVIGPATIGALRFWTP